MKIKKKEYYNELDNAYWNGVKAGINLALQNPKEAEQYKDNVELLRIKVKGAMKIVSKITEALNKAFIDKE